MVIFSVWCVRVRRHARTAAAPPGVGLWGFAFLTPPQPPRTRTLAPSVHWADALKPARGVVLSYPGGDNTWCPNDASGVAKNRTFSIELLCAPTQGTPATFSTSSVLEANVCDYRVQLKSLAGCPTACITGSTLCNGNGICGYNTDAKRSQCFCNAGASGAQCAAHPTASKQLGAEGIILIIVCLMLAGVLGLVGYMFMRLRKLSVDPSAYGELQGKYNGASCKGARAALLCARTLCSHTLFSSLRPLQSWVWWRRVPEVLLHNKIW